jgi:transcriptional regulator with XRE-family HTH domain
MVRSVFTPEYKGLVKLLIQARAEAGITQSELARSLGQPQSFVSKYEHCERRLDVAELLSISRALNVRASELIHQIEEGITGQ